MKDNSILFNIVTDVKKVINLIKLYYFFIELIKYRNKYKNRSNQNLNYGVPK
jgi:hypothetical protein